MMIKIENYEIGEPVFIHDALYRFEISFEIETMNKQDYNITDAECLSIKNIKTKEYYKIENPFFDRIALKLIKNENPRYFILSEIQSACEEF